MKLRYLPVIFFAVLFCACGPSRPAPLVLRGGGEFPREREFLLALLEEGGLLADGGFRLADEPSGGAAISGSPGGEAGSGSPGGSAESGASRERRQPEGPEVSIDFFSSWEFEDKFGDILLSRTWYVPREDPLAGRRSTALEDCLEGRETLVPLAELAAPFTALRVGDLSLEDEGYPLVKAVGIGIRSSGVKAGAKPEAAIQALEAALRGAEKPLAGTPPGLIWIAAGGDLMLDRGAAEILFDEGPAGIFGGTAELLARSDLALVNLEGAASGRGTKVKKSFNFRFDPKIAGALRDAGIDGVLQANNHAFDYGEEAFRDSLHYLAEAGIAALGTGLNDDEAARPLLFQKGGCRVRVYGIASFPRERNGWDGLAVAAGPETPGLLHARWGGGEKLKALFAADDGADTDAAPPSEVLDLVLFHGGVEWSRRPDAFTREFYTDLVRAGADLVIGSHPHIVQGFEWVLGKPVFWSLGNYVFGGMENTEGGEEGLFIRLGFSGGRLVYLEPHALALSHTRTAIAPAEGLETFYARSRELREAAPQGGTPRELKGEVP
jgi:poly-gamma-glutamate synthesis protein (capsule biosynthesis protein)